MADAGLAGLSGRLRHRTHLGTVSRVRATANRRIPKLRSRLRARTCDMIVTHGGRGCADSSKPAILLKERKLSICKASARIRAAAIKRPRKQKFCLLSLPLAF